MRVPQIQTRLRELAGIHAIPGLESLASKLSRRTPKSRAPVSSAPITPELRDAICAYHRAHPEDTQNAIAAVFNVNPGRVSEALGGQRQ